MATCLYQHLEVSTGWSLVFEAEVRVWASSSTIYTMRDKRQLPKATISNRTSIQATFNFVIRLLDY